MTLPANPGKPARAARTPRTALDRNEWVQGATEVLMSHGIEGLRVEVLAKNLGVTKGSFYWHFKDRRDLLVAVLQAWRDGRLRDIDKQAKASPGSEREQLLHVIDIYSANRNRRGIAIELAVRDFARRDADAAQVVEEVDAYRLEATRKLFAACGLDDREAKARSLLLYAYVFGQSLMLYPHFGEEIPGLKQWVAEHIALR